MSKVRVLCVCKSDMFILHIKGLMSNTNIEFVSIFLSTTDALEHYKIVKPDILLVDAEWNGRQYTITGSAFVKSVLNFNPEAKIIVVTNAYNSSTMKSFMDIGVRGYYYRSMGNAFESFVYCVEQVYKGDTCFQ